MKASYLNGCCAGKIFYDIGYAHANSRYKSQESFDKRVKEINPTSVNIAILNSTQNVERQYLLKQGWKEVELEGTTLKVYVISNKMFKKYLASLTRDYDLLFKRGWEKVRYQDVLILMDNALLTRESKERIEKFYGIKLKFKYLSNFRDSWSVFNGIKATVAYKHKLLKKKESNNVSNSLRAA